MVIHAQVAAQLATFESSLNELNMTIQNSTVAILPTPVQDPSSVQLRTDFMKF